MYSIFLICFAIFIITLAVRIYRKLSLIYCKSTKSLKDKVAIVTGGTSGMGFEVAKDFAKRGGKVIIACPFEHEGNEALIKIVGVTGNKEVIFKLLDLSSLESVRQFAKDVTKSEERLDILVNNAGVGVPGDFLTADGMNFIMQVNYFGHFLLTLLLLPLLMKTGTISEPSRIVNVSSILHKFTGSFDLNKLNLTGQKMKIQIYGSSKLCLLLFARALSKRIRNKNVVINSLHPGVVGTQIYSSVSSISKLLEPIVRILVKFLFKTTWEGCQTTLYLALDDEAKKVSGEYFVNCRVANARKAAYNDGLAEDLWEGSVRLVKLSRVEQEELKQCF